MREVADLAMDARAACDAVARSPRSGSALPRLQAEAALRAAHGGLVLDGVRLGLDELRDVARGLAVPTPGPAGAMVSGALRVAADVQRTSLTGTDWTAGAESLPQRLARWHAMATADLVGLGGGVGVPGRMRDAEQPVDLLGLGVAPVGDALSQRMAALAVLLAQPLPPTVSGVVVAAVAHGELLALRPFPQGNGVVARALLRWHLVTLGTDRTGTIVPEAVWSEAPDRYLAAAAGYASGEWPRVVAWVRSVTATVTRAADVALSVAEDTPGH